MLCSIDQNDRTTYALNSSCMVLIATNANGIECYSERALVSIPYLECNALWPLDNLDVEYLSKMDREI